MSGQIQYIDITKPELTHIKGPCLQKLVTWFKHGQSIGTSKTNHTDFHMARVN